LGTSLKATLNTSATSKSRRASERASDAWRVSLALVFILFASLASRGHESPEKVLTPQEVAGSSNEDPAGGSFREPKQKIKITHTAFLKRLTGINGAF
jgi:hypothetical protein